MMTNKIFAFAASMMLASVAFGDAANALISFASEGPDYYADGSLVADGEYYALVWSADGVFEGFNSDGTPIDANDEVVLKAPLAKNGKCPLAVFQIDSKIVKSTGVYAVCLLDTRKPAGGVASDKFGDINGATVAATTEAAKSSAVNGGSVAIAKASNWTVAGDAEGVKIVDFKVLDSKVQIKVDGLIPNATYLVNMGETPTNFNSYQIAVPDSEATFIVENGDATYFKVIRK